MKTGRKQKMTRLSTMLDDFVAPSVRKRGFVISRLVSEWPQIAGDMAQWSRPSQMNLSRKGGGTLKLAIASGFGPIAMQMRGALIERVNAAFGYRAIGEITFVQTLTPPKTQPASQPVKNAQIQPGQNVWDLDRKLERVKSPELRAALRRLGMPD